MTAPFNVKFRNDYRPVFQPIPPSSLSIYENQTTSTTLYTFHATDNDTGISGDIRYLLPDSSLAWLFDLSTTTGALALRASLDRENVSSYSMQIRASDSAPSPFELTRDHSLTVNVLDVNDNKPQYPWHILNISVPETIAINQAAFNVSTTDPDAGENARLTYTILSRNDSNKFQLDANTGVFIAKGKSKFMNLKIMILFNLTNLCFL